jgi:hypothetical protein
MESQKKTSKVFKVLCIVGSSLLLVMAIFHGSGFFYVKELITQSNAEGFLKDIVPVLFAHPSIHLIGLAAFGILALSLGKEAKKVLWLLSLFIIVDALLAFYLGGILPGFLLIAPALCFIMASNRQRLE